MSLQICVSGRGAGDVERRFRPLSVGPINVNTRLRSLVIALRLGRDANGNSNRRNRAFHERPPDTPWKWSISEAGDWLVQTWQTVADIPYIGLISLFLAGFLALILLTKVLR